MTDECDAQADKALAARQLRGVIDDLQRQLAEIEIQPTSLSCDDQAQMARIGKALPLLQRALSALGQR